MVIHNYNKFCFLLLLTVTTQQTLLWPPNPTFLVPAGSIAPPPPPYQPSSSGGELNHESYRLLQFQVATQQGALQTAFAQIMYLTNNVTSLMIANAQAPYYYTNCGYDPNRVYREQPPMPPPNCEAQGNEPLDNVQQELLTTALDEPVVEQLPSTSLAEPLAQPEASDTSVTIDTQTESIGTEQQPAEAVQPAPEIIVAASQQQPEEPTPAQQIPYTENQFRVLLPSNRAAWRNVSRLFSIECKAFFSTFFT